jgi:peptide/nickel transport system substrate-binding protein
MGEREALEELLARLTHDPITRRQLLRRAGAGAALLTAPGVLAACGGDGGGDQAARPRRGGRLVVGAREDAYETKGAEANLGQYPQNVNIFEGLVRMDADYQVVPVLAESWEFNAPNTWRFTLRQGVTFHDGTPFTAEAVKYSFDREAEAGGGTPGFDKKGNKIIDDFTIEVTPQFENRRLVEQIVHPESFIVAPGSNPGEKPIGTGPFRFGSYRKQQDLTVRRFDGYWGKKALLDEVVFRFLPDPNARRLAFEAGELDLLIDVPREAVADLEGKGFKIANAAPGAYSALYQNISGKKGYTVLQDSAVRHAIGYAIDRDTLVGSLFEGLAEPEQTMIPARLLGETNAAKIEGFTYDPDQATQLLEEAGWTADGDGVRSKDGQRLSIQLINGFPSAQTHGAVPEFLQDQLREVGIEVEIIKTPDTASYEERLVSGEGDLWIEQGSQNDANPAFLPALLFWSVGLFGDIGYQPLFAPGKEFDAIIVSALKSPDSEEVKSLVADAMRVLIDEAAVVTPLAGVYLIYAMRDKVQGFAPQPSNLQIYYDGVSLAA